VGEGWARYRQRRGLPEPVFKRSAYLKNGGHGAQRAVGTQSVCEVCKGDGCGGWGAASAMKLHTYGDVDGGQQRPSALYHTGRGPTNPHTPCCPRWTPPRTLCRPLHHPRHSPTAAHARSRARRPQGVITGIQLLVTGELETGSFQGCPATAATRGWSSTTSRTMQGALLNCPCKGQAVGGP
jgi:hypothetical protein